MLRKAAVKRKDGSSAVCVGSEKRDRPGSLRRWGPQLVNEGGETLSGFHLVFYFVLVAKEMLVPERYETFKCEDP